MKNLPMDLLRAFVSVAQLGSFTKAGELLGRSQPAITLKIKRLEELIDENLFRRLGKNMELSESGTALYDYANQILALNDLAISQFSKSAVAGKIRLGIPSEFATVLLPRIVSRFAKAYPNVTLEVRQWPALFKGPSYAINCSFRRLHLSSNSHSAFGSEFTALANCLHQPRSNWNPTRYSRRSRSHCSSQKHSTIKLNHYSSVIWISKFRQGEYYFTLRTFSQGGSGSKAFNRIPQNQFNLNKIY
jgi:DNA-binding transcriptional LysR family regulator